MEKASLAAAIIELHNLSWWFTVDEKYIREIRRNKPGTDTEAIASPAFERQYIRK